ncbi:MULTISPECIES: alpha-pore-forming cytotoxin subunit MakE [Flavobacteriaceae]|uniref:Uncharacterized protein n=2 Tax=Flavobacteriaceae TaxID=49546 RepID=A0A4Y8AWP4_9FLAO|nr:MULTISPECIES: hypothetical protein [Flavobacteriaceae]TEW76956.1 hypothetical protein E2488_03660 [Gramella jeungdoensis]GGK59030.1 hypothetical protein GCM10007963_28980 [Lutibacter litoralis]
MSFQASQIQEETNLSMNAMLMLNSSCQGLIQSNIEEVDTPWYPILSGELRNAEELVIDWRNNGFLYFKYAILNTMTTTGQEFLNNQTVIDNLYNQLNSNYSVTLKEKIVSQLQKLAAPISNISVQMEAYSQKLTEFGSKMQVIHSNMESTISKVQAEESVLKDEINEINKKIENLRKQIKIDREAIAKAKAARKKGILETIFGVLLAPFTLGASLILAGIGVASITEAESDISNMENSISGYQKSIAGDQINLSKDQVEVATLKSLLLGTGMTLDDMNLISSSLQVLKVSWSALGTELGQIISKTEKAENAQEAVVGQAWFDAACLEWKTIIPHAENLDNRTIQTKHISIGNK